MCVPDQEAPDARMSNLCQIRGRGVKRKPYAQAIYHLAQNKHWEQRRGR